jgi:L-iditol 2-dehydrogenase
MQLIQEGEVTMTGSHRYRNTWPDAIMMIADGKMDVDALVTSHFPLEQAQEAIRTPRRTPGSLKVCIDVSGTIVRGAA